MQKTEVYKTLKEKVDYCCEVCGMPCLKPGEKPKDRTDSYRRRLNIHHIDRNPNNNQPDNLVVICPGCHLHLHRDERNAGGANLDQLWLFEVDLNPKRGSKMSVGLERDY